MKLDIIANAFELERNKSARVLSFTEKQQIFSPSLHHSLLLAITNAAVDLSPVLLGILFTLVLLCFVIFAKLYCYRSTTTTTANSLHNGDTKHIGNINYKHDTAKVRRMETKKSIDEKLVI